VEVSEAHLTLLTLPFNTQLKLGRMLNPTCKSARATWPRCGAPNDYNVKTLVQALE
jgi:hypothetical protein